MKKIISMLIVAAILVVGLHIHGETFRTYVDPSGEFSFEYPRELVPHRAGKTVSFSDTPSGPFLISVRALSAADAHREACLYTENPDNDPGIQKFTVESGDRAVIVSSRGVDAERLRRSFRFIASPPSRETSAFSRKAREAGWRGKLKNMFHQ